MSRYKLTVEYEGTRYRGWQVQANARTVQGELLRAATRVLKSEQVDLQGAGRTDAGVHALGQVAHLDTPNPTDPARLQRNLNDALPPDINILDLRPAPPGFHARKSATARIYLYQVSRRRTALGKRFVWWVKDPLNFACMSRAARRYVGFHDFRAFMDSRAEGVSPEVDLEDLALREVGDLILFRVRGSHFLWKMVRRLVGVLVEAGRGNYTENDLAAFLNDDSPEPARHTAPPSGLFLERVLYGDEDLTPEPQPFVRL